MPKLTIWILEGLPCPVPMEAMTIAPSPSPAKIPRPVTLTRDLDQVDVEEQQLLPPETNEHVCPSYCTRSLGLGPTNYSNGYSKDATTEEDNHFSHHFESQDQSSDHVPSLKSSLPLAPPAKYYTESECDHWRPSEPKYEFKAELSRILIQQQFFLI